MRLDIAGARLHNQGLAAARFARPEEVVRWLGAVQAQEYPGAKWALAMRMRTAADAAIERAFAKGTILRTHVMRPTWHFVTPADIRWMLALTAPRVKAAMASYDRKLGLDTAVFRRSHTALGNALSGGRQLTRQELKGALKRAGVAADGVQRLAHLVMRAELDGLICSGERRGRQFTYALLDERVPPSRPFSRDEALAELTRRYFTSHGPAQVQDFSWWSGLTMGDARAGIALVDSELAHDTVEGKTHWFSSSMQANTRRSRAAHLLPLYDEYLIAYKDRRAAGDPARWQGIANRDPFTCPLVIGGQVVGGWKGTLEKGRVVVKITHLESPKEAHAQAIARAARAYADFLGMAVSLL